jgi:hypothetical protein
MSYIKIIAVVFTPVDGRCDFDEEQARINDRQASEAQSQEHNYSSLLDHQDHH